MMMAAEHHRSEHRVRAYAYSLGMALRAARRRLIASLLRDGTITSQAQLLELLAAEGHEVSQATISRDLQALGAIKAGDDGYTLGLRGASSRAEHDVGHALSEFALQITATGNLVVLSTPPGAAQVVAATIDSAALPGVIGTVAGDDTLLVIAEETVGGRAVAERLEQIGAQA